MNLVSLYQFEEKNNKHMSKYKIGDNLICTPGFDTSIGGSGYIPNRMFTVHKVTDHPEERPVVYWPGPDQHGIYGKAVTLAKTEFSLY